MSAEGRRVEELDRCKLKSKNYLQRYLFSSFVFPLNIHLQFCKCWDCSNGRDIQLGVQVIRNHIRLFIILGTLLYNQILLTIEVNAQASEQIFV